VRLSNVLSSRDRQFFDLFEEAGGNILRAARLLEELLQEYPERNELAREILICEQDGDRITHDIIQRLNQTFVTPIDREDIYELASALDDVVDYIENASDLLGLYKVGSRMEQSVEQCRVLVGATEHLAKALSELKQLRRAEPHIVGVKSLEDDGDRIVRDAIAALFEGKADPVEIIRWKDIFEALEDAIDSCETAADLVGNIVVKNV